MGFFLKKLIGTLLMPLPLGFLFLLMALILVWRGRRVAGAVIGGSVLSIWFALSLSPVTHLILAPLEFAYPKYAGQKVDAVIVLGGGHHSDQRIPLSSLLVETSLNRLVEGVMIVNQQPRATLALSGYKGDERISNARAMSLVARALRVDEGRIVLAEAPKDTAEEAAHWADVFRGKRVAVVTSATHMRRAVALFAQHGMQVIPAPTRFLSAGESGYGWRSWIPDARNLEYAEQAWHEYLGLLWAKLTA
ncbi:MAG: ElyC/SanA/YdcF family protein [Oleiphilaceae bacterium]|nr:ElyC/SanA/YdcF family protein [Oleiphilaceae bacterium]